VQNFLPKVFENWTDTLQLDGDDQVELIFTLWDTSGGEDFDRLRPLCYEHTDTALVCFALDSHKSLENARDKVGPAFRD
jgi:GTPase SAR1 family protein